MEDLTINATQKLANTPMIHTYTASDSGFYNLLAAQMQNALDLTGDASSSALSQAGLLSGNNSLIMSLLLNNNSSVAGPQGETAINAALTRVGDPYSQPMRGQGDYVDCSYLTQWAYGQAGVSLPGTAAAQAKYCDENGYTISPSELSRGDLVFWEKVGANEGRYKDIHHVGIYMGNGQVLDASSAQGQVVVRDLWSDDQWKVVQFARPY